MGTILTVLVILRSTLFEIDKLDNQNTRFARDSPVGRPQVM